MSPPELPEILHRRWDAIVVGTGMGGGILGRALANLGISVLFIEKGPRVAQGCESDGEEGIDRPGAQSERGAWPDLLDSEQDGIRRSFVPPLGCCVGGSSSFYAGTLERPEPHTFEGRWPVSHSEMGRWYDRAEALLAGRADPESPPQPPLAEPRPAVGFGASDAAIVARLEANGLRPYRLRSALRYPRTCPRCRGRPCGRTGRMDGRTAGVEPALATGHAALLDNCEVMRLMGSGTRITAVEVRRHGQTFVLHAPRVVLAAGALSTPRLLLTSVSEAWNRGCGNAADLVGRNLMFHLNELFIVWSGGGAAAGNAGATKEIGLRDLMLVEDHRLGMVQALGVDASHGVILHALRQRLSSSPLGRSRLAREAARVPALAAALLLGTGKLFVGLLEDFPALSNRVVHDPRQPSRIVVQYSIPGELHIRRALFRSSILRAFRGLWPIFLNYAPELNWGHPCGTTRMGTSPSNSVTDPSGRVHGMENLWIVDAGLFPTSLGVNPALTVAANALRISGGIAAAV